MQSTYCETMKEHCDSIGRSVHVVNLGGQGGCCWCGVALACSLQPACTWHPGEPIPCCLWHCIADPAAEAFKYPVSIDVRDLITLDDAMEELQLGPNGCVPGTALRRTPSSHPTATTVQTILPWHGQ